MGGAFTSNLRVNIGDPKMALFCRVNGTLWVGPLMIVAQHTRENGKYMGEKNV